MAVGIHWASSMSLDSLLEVASLDDLVEVRTAAVRALTRYAESKKEDVCRVLARIAAEPSEDPGLRAVAYIGLLRAEGLITAREKASLPQDIGSLEVDERLLRRWV